MHPPKPTPSPEQLFASVYPPEANPPPPVADGRQEALTTFLAYLTNVKYFKDGANPGEFIEFCIPEKNVEIDFADYETDFALPGLVVLAGEGKYNPNNLGPIFVEGSQNQYAPRTALHVHDEYEETFTLEFWAAFKTEIRGFRSAIEKMFQPSQSITGIRFYLQNYYDAPVLFTLVSSQIQEETDAANKRRRVTFQVNMRFNVLSLEPYRDFEPETVVIVE